MTHISQILAKNASAARVKVINPGRFISPAQAHAFLAEVRSAAGASASWALIGGLALQRYGCPRLSGNCDVASTKNLSFPSLGEVGTIVSGGRRWKNTDGSRLSVIVRQDGYRGLFEDAIKNAVHEDGIFVARLEWIAVMKFACLDPHHSLDLQWIMRRHGTGLVDVKKTIDLVHRHLGGQYARTAFERFMDQVEISLIREPDLEGAEYP